MLLQPISADSMLCGDTRWARLAPRANHAMIPDFKARLVRGETTT
ncbi:hypothetical protein [Ralstonia soli]|nr:hypothetical protein [Ralstonia soli]